MIKRFSEKGEQRNAIPAPSRPCRRFVRLSQPSRACTHQMPENRTLRRRAGVSGRATAQKPERLRAAFGGGEAASGEAGEKPGAFLRQPSHFCPQCGQFWTVKTALFCESEKWIGADFRKKPRLCRSCRHYFGAFHFWRG